MPRIIILLYVFMLLICDIMDDVYRLKNPKVKAILYPIIFFIAFILAILF